MVATGHATIYTWTCVGSEPRIAQAEKLDPRGFIAVQWAPLEKRSARVPSGTRFAGQTQWSKSAMNLALAMPRLWRSNRSQYANLNIFSLLHYIHKVLV